jgi:hydroxymethylbilane synthase
MTKIRIATRKSKLALWQTQHVKAAIERNHPNITVSLVEIVTEGDRQQNVPLTEIGGKSLFVKALQQALLNDEADIAVHSMKDMSVFQAEALMIGAVLARADARDAFVSTQYATIAALPQGAVVGTASPRRSALIKSIRPDIEIKLLRGNVDTRLLKLENGDYDAIILAAAGLDRLALSHCIRERLSDDIFTPAIAQGAIAIECREQDHFSRETVQFLHDEETYLCVSAERAVNQVIGGDCHTPIGAYAKIIGDQLLLNAVLGQDNQLFRADATGAKEKAAQLGEQVGLALKTRC